MKYIWTSILILLFVPFLFCCKEPKSNVGISVVELYLNEKSFNHVYKSLIDSIEFLPLQETEQSYFISISKITVCDSMIYIFDKLGGNSLMSFDLDGKFITSYSEKGNGAEEYLRLWDFDVDSNYVYLYDRAKRKMMYYTHNGDFVKERLTPFCGDGFAVLDNGGFLFSLAKEGNTEKLCRTDSLFSIKECFLNYEDGEIDDKITDNLFQKCGDVILYNQPVDDYVYAFSLKGNLLRCFHFNFDGCNVPEEKKLSYTDLVEDGKCNYMYFYDCPLFVNEMFIGSVFHKGNKGAVLFDMKEEDSGVRDWTEGMRISDLVLPLHVTNDCVIGWMDYSVYNVLSDSDEIPSDMVELMKNGGKVLVLYHLRKDII